MRSSGISDGRPLQARASRPDSVVHRDRDVVRVRAGGPDVGEQVEERARGFGLGGQLLRRRMAGNAHRDVREIRRHAVELLADEGLDTCRRGGIGGAQPPALEHDAGQAGDCRRDKAGSQQAAPAHILEQRPDACPAEAIAGKGQSHSSSRIPQR